MPRPRPTQSATLLNIESLITRTDAFLRTMHFVQEDFTVLPRKQHIATCIDYADLQEMRDDFIQELTNTVTAFVYSSEKQQRLIQRFQEEGRDTSGAYNHLLTRARSKFRSSFLQGQFSELLLCNLLQHYFRAAPLLRKMPITTNPALERNGSDAIHIATRNNKYVLYIGEAKTYDRQGDSLRVALVDAIRDVAEKHYHNHRRELELYTYEDFLPEELETIASGYINNTLKNVEVHLVCIVTYDWKDTINGTCREELLDCIIEGVRQQVRAARNHPIFEQIPPNLIPRLNYILFPVQRMQDLIHAFQQKIGHA